MSTNIENAIINDTLVKWKTHRKASFFYSYSYSNFQYIPVK